jgi:TRAP-type C4-dicarboxylate transport system permease small subunit
MRHLRSVLTFRWAHTLSEAAGYLSAAALLAATGVMVHGVATRYFLGHPTVWQTELSIYLLMFVTFVGASYGLRHHAHVGVDVLVERLPDRAQLVVRLLTSLVVVGLLLVVAWRAGSLWWDAVQGGWHSSTAWRAPLSVVYAILPLGMLLLVLQYAAFVAEAVAGLTGRTSPAEALAALGRRTPATDGPEATAGPSPGDEARAATASGADDAKEH